MGYIHLKNNRGRDASGVRDHLEQTRITNLLAYNAEAFSRNIGLLTMAEQEKLASVKVAIAGMGGVGGVHLVTLLRTGFAHFNIADLDEYELVNMNRQYGAKTSNMGQPKADVMVKEGLEINPYAEITSFSEGVNEENIDQFLRDVDIVVDGMDAFNIKIRRLIFNKSLEKGIPVITAGPIGFSTALIVFMPEKMGFDEYFNIRDSMDEEHQLLRFFIGLTPSLTHWKYMRVGERALRNRSGPSLGLACQMCSAAATTEVLRIILNKGNLRAAPHYFQYDLFTRRFVKKYMPFGNRNLIQKLKLSIAQKRLANLKPVIGPEKVSPPVLDGRITSDIPDDVIWYLLKAGQQAPSGENIQPWYLACEKNKIIVTLNPEADKSLFNVRQMASSMSCGAVAENIKIAASRYHLDTRITLNDLPDEKNLTAEISLQADNVPEDSKARFIWERQTNRTRFNRKPVPDSDLDRLKQECEKIDHAALDLFTSKSDIENISSMVASADIVRMETQSLHESLMAHIRFTDEEALATRNGFHLKNLEAGFDGEIFLRMTKSWKTADRLNKFGMAKAAAKVAAKGMKQASAIGMLRIKGTDQKSFFRGGRAMQRVWLEATRLGLSFQPMTSLNFFRMNWMLGREDAFNPEHKELLKALWVDYERQFICNSDESHLMLFRLGYGKRVKVGTLREETAAWR